MPPGLLTQLGEFIQEGMDRQYNHVRWISDDVMKVYVRKSRRYINDKLIICLDLASIEVIENKRGQGIFTAFLGYAHALNPWDVTYIENVLAPRFARYFRNNNWCERDIFPPSFYKFTENQS